ncbi:MAG: hypothetical protein Q8K93_25360, partial [Reyranella sp.]|nr:hypothetical protein [Reyranella sp.]
ALFGVSAALEAAQRAAVTASSYLLVGMLLTVSLGFFTLSGYRALLSALGDVYAALIIGCVYLVAALIAMLAVQRRRH